MKQPARGQLRGTTKDSERICVAAFATATGVVLRDVQESGVVLRRPWGMPLRRDVRRAFLLVVLALSPVIAQAQGTSTSASPHGALTTPCAQCHRADAWKPVRISREFTHADGFPLEGAHARATCASCHTRLDFTGVARTCTSCHRDEHKGELGANCAQCHTVRSFLDVTHMRERHQTTAFPLTGAHAAVDCKSCHTSRAPGQQAFLNIPATCSSCHTKDYDAARSPPHASAGFPRDCAACHSTTAWRGLGFDHNATQFPLTGAHRAATCVDCHRDGVYRGKATACVSCHQANYNATTTPGHAAAGFATTCETCHTQTAWTPASFDHSTTAFPLTGAHLTTTCSQCHGDGVYKGKPTACVSCHLSAYDATTNPNHAAAQFATDCATCHTTSQWLGATFDHDSKYFPIYSGAHAGRWSSCTQCHATPTNFADFTCLTCHLKAKTDEQHQGRTGYVYASANCYACHPRGRSN